MHDKKDKKYMKKALKLARLGMFTVTQNPKVGCLLVKNGKIIAKGYHQRFGGSHAEAMALQVAADKAKGSTAYVTLEPCSHHGKNPPCAEALITAGVKRVVVCNDDVNPLVAGKGLAKLSQAGITVDKGVLANKGLELNRGFFHRMQTNLPWVRLKQAQSVDGRTAMNNGDSHWISGRQSRSDVQYWRARSGAIVTGIDTVIHDDCRLTVRVDELPKKYRSMPHNFTNEQPLRVVLDSDLRLPLNAKIIGNDGRCVVFTKSDKDNKIKQLQEQQVNIIKQPKDGQAVALQAVLKWLGEQAINEVLFECGATLAGGLWKQQLLNEWLVYTAPTIMGSTARPLLNLTIEEMDKRLHIEPVSIDRLGKDWRLRAIPKWS